MDVDGNSKVGVVGLGKTLVVMTVARVPQRVNRGMDVSQLDSQTYKLKVECRLRCLAPANTTAPAHCRVAAQEANGRARPKAYKPAPGDGGETVHKKMHF